MDADLRSIQESRTLLATVVPAQKAFAEFPQDSVDEIVSAMARAGARAAEPLAVMAHEETGFGRVESKVQKNLFATRTLVERMKGMKTCGVIRKEEQDSVWEIATPMGVIAALIPSTNPTSTAMYKAIIAAKARCGLVVSPHPRARRCTAEAVRVVSEAAYRAGAPEGLFGCMTEISVDGTNALLEDARTDLILATGGSAMVKAAYSKGKPAYGVGSGNVPAYVDRSADLDKAARDIVYGASFDHGTLCSTERSIVADLPIRDKLLAQLRKAGAHIVNEREKELLRSWVWKGGRLNIEQVGKSPAEIAGGAGFSVPSDTRVLVAEVQSVGRTEPLSVETLSPILSFYTVDGWREGCERCQEILAYGGIGHTLGLHAANDRIIEAFALEKPAMRIVVNTVCALGAIGFTNRLFPAMTLGPGTVGGSITSDNISPLHLLNIKRLAFETDPINAAGGAGSLGSTVAGRAGPTVAGRAGPTVAGRAGPMTGGTAPAGDSGRFASRTSRVEMKGQGTMRPPSESGPWMSEIDARLRARAGNPAVERESGMNVAGSGAYSDSEDVRSVPAPDAASLTGRPGSPSMVTEDMVTEDTVTEDTVTEKNRPPTKESGEPAPGGAGSLSLPDARIEEIIRQFRRG